MNLRNCKRMILVILIVFLNLFSLTFGDNKYCNATLCGKKQHVACGKDLKKLGPLCPKDAEVYLLNNTQKANIVRMHNEARNLIACGKIPPFPKADRMPQIQWDEELANLAQYNANSCQFAHDQCRNTAQYKAVGQNIAYLATYKKQAEINGALARLITAMWFQKEYKLANKSDITSFKCPPSPDKIIGHFTQMVNDQTTKVGCAITRYTNNKNFKQILLVCDYSYSNICSSPVYVAGAKEGSQCVTGRNSTYPCLCGPNEIVDPYSDDMEFE